MNQRPLPCQGSALPLSYAPVSYCGLCDQEFVGFSNAGEPSTTTRTDCCQAQVEAAVRFCLLPPLGSSVAMGPSKARARWLPRVLAHQAQSRYRPRLPNDFFRSGLRVVFLEEGEAAVEVGPLSSSRTPLATASADARPAWHLHQTTTTTQSLLGALLGRATIR